MKILNINVCKCLCKFQYPNSLTKYIYIIDARKPTKANRDIKCSKKMFAKFRTSYPSCSCIYFMHEHIQTDVITRKTLN